jgi:hypothetical protein
MAPQLIFDSYNPKLMMNNSLFHCMVTREDQIWWQKEATNRPPAGQVILYISTDHIQYIQYCRIPVRHFFS